MFAAILMFGEPGVEILYPDPGFPIYRSMIEFTGATPVPGTRSGKRRQVIGRRRVPLWRRAARWLRVGPSRPTAGANAILPHLIKVLAGFSKVDGVIEEAEIDSSLSALRHDFPKAVYSELRRLYRAAR